MAGGTTGMARVVAVAYSGGRDSSALLHATRAAAGALGVRLVALHVNHRLSRFADAWEAHCRVQCERLGIALAVERLVTGPPRGASVEAWARAARQDALRRLALGAGAGLVLLAHHRRDQAETLLLQALRGGGVAGLAGMPPLALRDGVIWARPWLQVPREHIDAYVAAHAIAHVDDDSNTDPRWARNRLRLVVWPAFEAAFPHAEAAFARSADWAWQAAVCIDELAQIDLAALDAASPGGAYALPLREWQRLSLPRRSNALRAWLRRATGQGAPATLIERLLRELPVVGSASWPCDGKLLRRHRGLLRAEAEPTAAAFAGSRPPAVGQADPPSGIDVRLAIRRAGRYRLAGWSGCIRAERVDVGGVPLAWLARLDAKPRTGGERFQAAIGRPPRSLKKQFQAAGVAAWARDAPLLFSGGQLVFVPGLGIDSRVVALPGQPQLRLCWEPAAARPSATARTTALPKIEG